MSFLKRFLFLVFVMASLPIFSQYLGYTPINEAHVNPWVPQLEFEYYGSYHFGDSEGESTLIVLGTATEVIAQIKSGEWNDDATDWIWNYTNLTNVHIDAEGKFWCDEYSGQFVNYTQNGKKQACLKIYDSWSGVTQKKGEYELGPKVGELDLKFPGEYPEASTRDLRPEELKKLTPAQLRIMRNEIYARYGYKFRPDGKMNAYFTQQSWFKGQHGNVDDFLTVLEKRNIKLIQQEEKLR